MPKSTKHKKARVADFAKAKLKLGKGKQIANNATNTSFASRSIALPTQSLSSAPTTEPTSRRNHTLPTLLVQSRHYSSPVKKEALLEISLLIAAHRYLIHQHLLPIISNLSHLISDAVPSLRASARDLLRTICDALEKEHLAAASKGLVLFTLASLSSLDEGTRIDALKVLDLLMEKIPDEIVKGWEDGVSGGTEAERGVGAKVVEGLMGVLRVRSAGLAPSQGGFTSAASGDLSPPARLAILRTLSTFLSHAFSSATSSSNVAWYLSPSFQTPQAHSSFLRSFLPVLPVQNPYTLASSSTTSLHPLSSLFLEKSSASTSTSINTSLLPLLYPTLLASFLDAAPTAFAPASTFVSRELDTVVAVLGVAKSLYWNSLGAGAVGKNEDAEKGDRKSLVGLLGHASAYFPFGSDALEVRGAESENQLMELNLVFASLVSLLILSAPLSSTPKTTGEEEELLVIVGGKKDGKKEKSLLKKRDKQNAVDGKIATMVDTVAEWVVSALRGELTSPTYPLGMPLSSEAYQALEPTLWSLLNQNGDASSSVWEGILYHFSKLPSGGETKKISFGFVSRTVLVSSDPAYVGRYGVSEEEARNPSSGIGKWILGLPKYLWELGVKDQDTTESVLQVLHRFASRGPRSLFSSLLPSLPTPLSPFFHLQHPKRGSIPGPFTKLGTRVQMRALALVWYVLLDGSESGKSLREAVGKAVEVEGVEEAVRRRARGLLM